MIKSMTKAKIYLSLAVMGAILPYSLLVRWLWHNDLNLPLFFQNLTANSLSLFAWADVLLCAIASILFIMMDSRAVAGKFRFIAVTATLIIGPSCGLPLYLYFRASSSNPSAVRVYR